MTKKILLHLLIITSLLSSFSCQRKTVTGGVQVVHNSKKSLEKPYLILISLDGFRWDYVDRFNPPHLSQFIENGARAESLVPSFPSKTFPNHYTIATGMYPDNHGLLGNSYYNYEKKDTYSLRDRSIVQDGSWYGGTPIWVQAAKAGMVTASYFFVGSEADVQGIRPTYYYNYDGSVSNETRVEQALDWLKLPAIERPHLLTMYFSDMDDIGHRVGPNDDKPLEEKLLALDQVLGQLFTGVKATGLPVNIIIVSDHGMQDVPIDKYLPIEMVENDELYQTVSNGSIVSIHPKNIAQTDSIFQDLKSKENNFKVYKTADTPFFEYTPQNENWGPIQIIPDDEYYFMGVRAIGLRKAAPRKVFGHHGFDTNLKEMHGIFYAQGPAIQSGAVSPSIKNIHVYPLMCEILGLDIPKDIDGNLNQLKNILNSK